jgi:hypothetical protein
MQRRTFRWIVSNLLALGMRERAALAAPLTFGANAQLVLRAPGRKNAAVQQLVCAF